MDFDLKGPFGCFLSLCFFLLGAICAANAIADIDKYAMLLVYAVIFFLLCWVFASELPFFNTSNSLSQASSTEVKPTISPLEYHKSKIVEAVRAEAPHEAKKVLALLFYKKLGEELYIMKLNGTYTPEIEQQLNKWIDVELRKLASK